MRSFRYYTGALRSPIAPVFLGVFTAFQQQAPEPTPPNPGSPCSWHGHLSKGRKFQGAAEALEPASSSTMDRQKMRDWGMLILGMRSFKPWAKESLGLMKMPVKL